MDVRDYQIVGEPETESMGPCAAHDVRDGFVNYQLTGRYIQGDGVPRDFD